MIGNNNNNNNNENCSDNNQQNLNKDLNKANSHNDKNSTNFPTKENYLHNSISKTLYKAIINNKFVTFLSLSQEELLLLENKYKVNEKDNLKCIRNQNHNDVQFSILKNQQSNLYLF